MESLNINLIREEKGRNLPNEYARNNNKNWANWLIYHFINELSKKLLRNRNINQWLIKGRFNFEALNKAYRVCTINFTKTDHEFLNSILWSKFFTCIHTSSINQMQRNTAIGRLSFFKLLPQTLHACNAIYFRGFSFTSSIHSYLWNCHLRRFLEIFSKFLISKISTW